MNIGIFFSRKKILVDTLYYLLASVIPSLLLLVINPFLAKELSPKDYAIIGYISSFASIVTPIVTFMLMRYYFSNYFRVDTGQQDLIRRTMIQTLIVFSFLLSILVIIGISIYHYYFNSSSTIPLYPYVLLYVLSIWLGAIFTFQLSEYRIQRLSKKYFCLSISNGIVKVLMLFSFVVLLGFGALGYELAVFLTALVYFIFSLYRYRNLVFGKINKQILFESLNFCWPIALAGCLEFFSHGLGRVMLERVGNDIEYGYYSVGNQFSIYMNLITTALFMAFNPDIYENTVQGNNGKLLKILTILLVVESITVFLFILLAPYIINLLTAGRYVFSVRYAQILSLSQIFILIFNYINDVTIAYGYTKIIMWTKIIVGLLSIMILQFLINKYSYIGAAWGQSIIYIFYIIINLGLLFTMKYKRSNVNFK